MRLSKRLPAAIMLMAAAVPTVSAADFFDTSAPERFFNLGFRAGVNTSNFTVDRGVFNYWNSNSWGTGFDAGVVADLSFRDYITLQPGFFFESRSGNYSYIYEAPQADAAADPDRVVQVGHTRTTNFIVPIVASVRFNITDDVRWSVDFGPYFQFRLTKSGECLAPVVDLDNYPQKKFVDAESNSFDFGFKMGMGLNIKRHYYVGVHYLAGATDVWKTAGMGGRNKAWAFTIGYDLW